MSQPTWQTNQNNQTMMDIGNNAGYSMNKNNMSMMDNSYNNAMSGGNSNGFSLMNPFASKQVDYSGMSTDDMMKQYYGDKMNKMNQGPSLMDIGSFGMNAYNMYNQWGMQKEQMNLAKEQMGMAREQWDMTKDEVNRIAGVRKNLISGYNNGGNYSNPQTA